MVDNRLDERFYEVMKAEHRELGIILGDIRDEVSAQTRSKTKLENLIGRLRELVEAHFSHEERGGYLKEALERAPRFIVQAAVLQDQHETLLEEVEKLRLLVHSGIESPAWWNRVESDFRAFAGRFMNHEQDENKIVQEAFTVDIGAAD
jgi:hemerythrin